MSIIDDLIAVRRLKRLTTGDVAEKSGIALRTLYYCETRRHEPKLETLQSWADALGCQLMLMPKDVLPHA